MNNMKSLSIYLLAAGLLAVFAPATSAAPKGGAKRAATAQERFRQLVKELDLSENQQRLLAVGLKNYFDKLKAVKENPKLTQRQKLESMAKILDYIDDEFKAQLSPKQYRKYLDVRGNIFSMPQPNKGPGAQLTKDLGLSLQQQLRLVPVFQDQMAKVRTIQANPRLNLQQKIQELQAIRRALDAEMKSNLTVEQYKIWLKIANRRQNQRFPSKK